MTEAKEVESFVAFRLLLKHRKSAARHQRYLLSMVSAGDIKRSPCISHQGHGHQDLEAQRSS